MVTHRQRSPSWWQPRLFQRPGRGCSAACHRCMPVCCLPTRRPNMAACEGGATMARHHDRMRWRWGCAPARRGWRHRRVVRSASVPHMPPACTLAPRMLHCIERWAWLGCQARGTRARSALPLRRGTVRWRLCVMVPDARGCPPGDSPQALGKRCALMRARLARRRFWETACGRCRGTCHTRGKGRRPVHRRRAGPRARRPWPCGPQSACPIRTV